MLERARDIFEQALEACPSDYAKVSVRGVSFFRFGFTLQIDAVSDVRPNGRGPRTGPKSDEYLRASCRKILRYGQARALPRLHQACWLVPLFACIRVALKHLLPTM
jgi:hypothetical protein